MKFNLYNYQPPTLQSVHERYETVPKFSEEDFSQSTWAGAVSGKFLRAGKMQTKPRNVELGALPAQGAEPVS